jgi:hypothetical protein
MPDSPWISIVENCPIGLSEKDTKRWRISLVERLRTGMMPALAARWTKRWIVDHYGNDAEPTVFGNPKDCWDGKNAISMLPPTEVKKR